MVSYICYVVYIKGNYYLTFKFSSRQTRDHALNEHVPSSYVISNTILVQNTMIIKKNNNSNNYKCNLYNICDLFDVEYKLNTKLKFSHLHYHRVRYVNFQFI